MNVNAIYSSIGRIRTVVMFDSCQRDLAKGAIAQAYEPVIAAYKDLAEALNSIHPTRILVFITINRTGPMHGAWFDEPRNIHFIPVNYESDQGEIPTRWTQDVLGVLQQGTLHIMTNLDKWVREQLAIYFPGVTIKSSNQQCVGGNIRRGLRNGKDYILKSRTEKELCTEETLHALTGVPTHRITSVFHPGTTPHVAGTMFHADFYSTVVGDIGEDKDLILVAEPYNEKNWTELNTALDNLQERLEATEHGDQKVFRVERLPLIMINDEDNKFTHAFSYNNCLVENYVENGIRQINFYFPDFRRDQDKANSSQKWIAEHFGKKTVSPIGHNKEHEHHEPKVTSTMLRAVEEEIEARLKAIFQGLPDVRYNVKFVRHNFRSSSQSRGGLHCLVKVIERDLIA